METLAAVALSALAFAVVGYPLLRGRSPSQSEMASDGAELEDKLFDRESAYDAIAELEFDHKAGTLDDADFQDLRGRYLRRAALVLKEIDEIKGEAPRATRRGGGRTATAVRKRQAAAHQQRNGTACPGCGTAIESNDNFCVGCGASLARRCTACGAPYESGDKFCTSCGGRLGGSK